MPLGATFPPIGASRACASRWPLLSLWLECGGLAIVVLPDAWLMRLFLQLVKVRAMPPRIFDVSEYSGMVIECPDHKR